MRFSPVSFYDDPEYKRHPNNTKTDQLLISEVISGLPRPYHHTVRTGSVHAHILTKLSRSSCSVFRLELIEPGAATCAYNEAWARERSDRDRFLGIPGPFLKSLDSCIVYI